MCEILWPDYLPTKDDFCKPFLGNCYAVANEAILVKTVEDVGAGIQDTGFFDMQFFTYGPFDIRCPMAFKIHNLF